jgi:hypothetical protein
VSAERLDRAAVLLLEVYGQIHCRFFLLSRFHLFEVFKDLVKNPIDPSRIGDEQAGVDLKKIAHYYVEQARTMGGEGMGRNTQKGAGSPRSPDSVGQISG